MKQLRLVMRRVEGAKGHGQGHAVAARANHRITSEVQEHGRHARTSAPFAFARTRSSLHIRA